MSEQIRFLASLPPIQSAFNIDGDAHGSARLKLDVPGTEIAQVVRLLALRGKLLRVTVEVEE